MKVQLTIEVNFISLKPGSDEPRIMYTKSDNIEIMFGDDNDDIIEQLFESLLKKYEEHLFCMALTFYIMILTKLA